MAYDLEEQEKLAEFKAWWTKYGNAVTLVVAVAALTVAGYNGWNAYQARQTSDAARLYDQMQKALSTKNITLARETSGVLEDKFGRTVYAEMAALTIARSAVDAGDLQTAKIQLQWAAEHAGDDDYRWIAKLRLAAVLVDEGSYDEANRQLAGDVPLQFRASFLDRRGDVKLAQNKIAEARQDYQSALEALAGAGTQAQDAYRDAIQTKLDALASAVTNPSVAKSDAPAGITLPTAPQPGLKVKP